ncbi:alpha/beta fold hydrolase [Sulfitobacter sp. S190]|uniref:alpha/beta fold hydrolase n=1 Tax=Sulfitobacter sp. S190 TaxID=2867022 RepID=UPI0021A3D3EB|nr:alpha/beta fold hydrolase [Sulfitobacter sp. S190]UWR22001.1 alpha/beta fold hydrolase [Sulfitobacter sp. S190]
MPSLIEPTQPIAGFETNRIALRDGITTRVLDTGTPQGADPSAPPVVLVHGLAASIEIWRDILPTLAASYRVVAFDLPGFGHSDKPDVDYRALSFFVPMFHAFLDAAGIDKGHMVGSSLGASLLIRHGSRHPERYASAVCANPGGFGTHIHPFLRVPTIPGLGAVMSRPQRATNAFGVRIAVHKKAKRTRALVDEVDAFSRLPGAHRAFVRTLRGIATPLKVKEMDVFEREARQFEALEIPTRVVWGEQDRIFPVAQLETVQDYMPSARREVLPEVGHYPQIDAPDAFCTILLDHLHEAEQRLSHVRNKSR